MLQNYGKRRFVAAAAAVVLAMIGAGCASEQPAPTTPFFARMNVSEKCVVYFQIQGWDELRAAMSLEGLQAAAPIKIHIGDGREASERTDFALPIPSDQLPAGITAIKASLALTTPTLLGELTVCRSDAQKAEWQYVSKVEVAGSAKAENAPSISFPDFGRLRAAIETNPSAGNLGIGLRLTAGGATLADVLKNGQPVQVKMVVADASGAVIASRAGPLADFGFS